MASQALIVKYEQAVNKVDYERKLYSQGGRSSIENQIV